MNAKALVCSVLAAVASAVCADVEFANVCQQYVSSDVVFTAQTPKQVDFPSDVGTPIFWLDCSCTNGWTFNAEGGVLKLPSKVPGSTRYLTSDKNDPNFENFSWKCWGYPNQYAVRDPKWVEPPVFTAPSDGLAGYGVLDFGDQGSFRALLFDLWSPDEATCAKSNVLANIGSVIAVYDSANGGGYFLGGGRTSRDFGYAWSRVAAAVRTDGLQNYSDGMFVSPHAHPSAYNGKMRHFGYPVPRLVGFGGGWETLALCPANGVADMDATSIGGGDMRSASDPSKFNKFSGGMRIAEMIFFDRALSDEETLKVETYLRSKWLTKPDGWNGNAVLSAVSTDSTTDDKNGQNAPKLEIAAGAGETAVVKTVSGGHFDSALVKTGAGTMSFGAAPNFSTPLDVREGTLSFARRPVPADVPGHYVFRMDAKRTDLITKDTGGNVSRIANDGGHAYYGRDLCLVAPAAQPKLVADVLGVGRPVFEFGKVSETGAYLKFATNEEDVASYPTLKIQGVCSVVAVVGVQNGGGNLLGSRYLRRGTPTTSYKNQLLVLNAAGDDATAYVDGLRRDPTLGYPTPGYHVVALQATKVDSDGAIGVGCDLGESTRGGMRIAEAVVYDRILSDEELRDASAYLMNKWFGRVPGDYQDPAATAGSVELQKLKLAEGTSIDVPEGGVAKVGRLDLKYPVAKTGKGTLVVQESKGAASLLNVKEGQVVFEAAPDVTAADELAQGASLHLDAADAASLETEDVEGTCYVNFWHSPGYANLAYSPDGRRPWLSAAETLNGKPTVVFGEYGTRSVGNYLIFGKPLCSIKSAYVVWRGHNAGVSILGTSQSSEGAPRASYDYVSANGKLLRNNLFSAVYTNGVAVSRTDAMPVDQWMLVEIHSKDDDTGGLTASALCADRDNNGYGTGNYGGSDYAEVILFERELSEREKIATRNYLLKKWFPAAPRAELPSAPEKKPNAVAELDVSTDTSEDISSGETLAVGRLVGSGTLAKTGDGTLAVRDLAELTGAVDVLAGTLKLTGTAPTSDGPAADGLVYHADSQWGITTETTADGVKKVVEWKSKLDDGWTAVPPIAWGDSKPRYLENALNGKTVVDLAVPTDTNVLQCLRFKKDGEYALLPGLRTVIWVIGSQNGGGCLLGGGDANNGGKVGREWARLADNQLNLRCSTVDDPILYGGADTAGRFGSWHVNGVLGAGTSYDSTNHWMSGSWDILSWDTKSSSRLATADGFGFDRAMLEGEWSDDNHWRQTGQQRLAEVLFYDKTLTDAERTATENYLAAKWGLLSVRSTVENEATVVLADDATLDMDGKDQFVGTLGGTGAVVNGTGKKLSLGAVSFDCAQDGCLSIASTVEIVEGFTVNFANFPVGGDGVLWKIAEVEGFVNSTGTSRIALTGVPEGRKAKIRFRDGALYVEFSKGLVLIVR